MKSKATLLISLILCLLFTTKPASSSTGEKEYCVVFYNVENLFDNIDDPDTNDEEFTPAGEKHWSRYRLDKKVKQIYKALIVAGKGKFPDIIGLAEVENLWVIEYLLKNTPMKKIPYRVVHKESPDMRGIDVALLYRKDRVIPIDFDFFPVVKMEGIKLKSRDILYFCSEIEKERIHFFVNHWPSRYGGYNETKKKRAIAAGILRDNINDIFSKEPNAKIISMGDYNATPDEDCMVNILGALPEKSVSGKRDLINLSSAWTGSGTGTLRSRGKWEIFDQFICSQQFLFNDGLSIDPKATRICSANFLLEKDEKYLGKKPYRTYLGPRYHGGVSDHLPIVAVIRKE